MIPGLSIGPRTLLNDCNHSATAYFWRSAIEGLFFRDVIIVARLAKLTQELEDFMRRVTVPL